ENVSNKVAANLTSKKSQEEISPVQDHGPAVHRMAAEQNIDLSNMKGSGKGGRITKADLINNKNLTKENTQNTHPGVATEQKDQAGGQTPTPLRDQTNVASFREDTRKPMS